MDFADHFQTHVKQDSAHASFVAMKTQLDDAIPTMRAGKVLLMEVMCVKAVNRHGEAMAQGNVAAANESSAVIGVQESWVASNKYGVSSEMLHANLWKMAIQLGK